MDYLVTNQDNSSGVIPVGAHIVNITFVCSCHYAEIIYGKPLWNDVVSVDSCNQSFRWLYSDMLRKE